MQRQITDPDLKQWIMPKFSTTIENDRVVASVAFMGAMSGYFDFGGKNGCGLPSVTLLGERRLGMILDKLEEIRTLGDEPAQWYALVVIAFLLKSSITCTGFFPLFGAAIIIPTSQVSTSCPGHSRVHRYARRAPFP